MEKIVHPDKAILDEVLVSLERDFDKKVYPFLCQAHISYFKKKFLKKFVGNADAVLYIARDRAAIAGVMLFRFLKWDTDIFGFKIGRFEHILMRTTTFDSCKFIDEVMSDIKSQRYKHVNCRVGLKDYKTLSSLEEHGFILADIQLTLSTPDGYQASSKIPANFIIRGAVAADLEHLKNIVKGGFTDTRFVNDARYPKEGVDRMYSEWIKNAFHDPSKRIFVAEEKPTGKIGGFIMGGIDADGEECLGHRIGFFELAAVSKDYRNHGIFQGLIRYFVAWFKERNMEKIEARTQVSNVQALKALMNGGLNEVCGNPTQSPGITMHCWF